VAKVVKLSWLGAVVGVLLLIALALVQKLMINSHGSAPVVGNLIESLSRLSSEVGRAVGWDELAREYRSYEGPVHHNPTTNPAWPYWWWTIAGWVVVSGIVLGVVHTIHFFAVLFFGGRKHNDIWESEKPQDFRRRYAQMSAMFAYPDTASAKSSRTDAIKDAASGITRGAPSAVAAAWQGVPFLWQPINLNRVKHYEADEIISGRLMRRGALCIVAGLLSVWFGITHGLWSIFSIMGLALLVIAFFTLREGSALGSEARLARKEDETRREDLERQLKLNEYGPSSRPRWELEHNARVMAEQRAHELELARQLQAHEAGQAMMQREHQRLLLAMRQPHELRLQAGTLPGTLLLIRAQITAEDKLTQYAAMLARSQSLIDQVTKDSTDLGLDEATANKRLEKAIESIMDLISAWTRDK
jgi:hypothetical protein